MDLFNQIGKVVGHAVNTAGDAAKVSFNEVSKVVGDVADAAGDAAKQVDLNEVGKVVGDVANAASDAVKKVDPTAIGAVATGGIAGAGLSTLVGGMGLAVGGTAVAIGMAPVADAGAGAIIRLGAYGMSKAISTDSQTEDKEDNKNV
jgi:hypothetical protein